MILKKLTLSLFILFLFGIINFGCNNDNPITTNKNNNQDLNNPDGHVHGTLIIRQLTDDGWTEILNTGDVYSIGGQFYDSGIIPFNSVCIDPTDFEIEYSAWWSLNPFNFPIHYIRYYIYDTHFQTPKLIGFVLGHQTFGYYGSISNLINNEEFGLQGCNSYGWRITISPEEDENITSK